MSKKADNYNNVEEALNRFVEKLRSRGANGILGIARQFKVNLI